VCVTSRGPQREPALASEHQPQLCVPVCVCDVTEREASVFQSLLAYARYDKQL